MSRTPRWTVWRAISPRRWSRELWRISDAEPLVMPETNVEQLLERLAARKPVPGVFLLGGDSYLREICRKKIVEAYVEEASRDWAVARFSAREDSADAVLGQ